MPTHLAPAWKPAVITPFSADPILFLQRSSVTSGSQSFPMLSGLSSQVSLLRSKWPLRPELPKCPYPTVAMETVNYGLLVSSPPAPLGQQAHNQGRAHQVTYVTARERPQHSWPGENQQPLPLRTTGPGGGGRQAPHLCPGNSCQRAQPLASPRFLPLPARVRCFHPAMRSVHKPAISARTRLRQSRAASPAPPPTSIQGVSRSHLHGHQEGGP